MSSVIEKNEYIEVLENPAQVLGIYRAVENDDDWLNKFKSTSNLNIQIYAFGAARYLVNLPIPGKEWAPDLSIHNPASGYVRKIPLAFIDIPAVVDKVYHQLIPEDRLLECLGNISLLKELTNQLKLNIADQMVSDIKDALVKIWTTDSNYWEAAWDDVNKVWTGGNLFHYHPDYFRDPDWILYQLYNTSDEFLSPNVKFQKGFFFDGPISETDTNPKDRSQKAHWNRVPTNTLSKKRIYVILNNPIYNTLRIGKLSMSPSPRYIEFENEFLFVFRVNLPSGYEIIMQDSRVTVLRPRNTNKGLEHKYEPENQTNWFFLASKVYGGMVYCLNNCAWKSSLTKGRFAEPSKIGTI